MLLRPEILPALAAAALGALTWFALRPAPPVAAWLAVEAPRFAAVDRPLAVRVTPRPGMPPGMLKADLHWTTTHREHRGVLSGAPAQPVSATGSPLAFSLAVPARDELGSVRVVIFAGPTGRWDDSVAAVTSDPIEIVTAEKLSSLDPALRPLKVFDQRSDPAVVRADSVPLQAVVALLWTAAALRLWQRRSTTPAAACVLAAVWTALPMETIVGAIARDHFVSHRWYGAREALQLAFTALLVATTVWLGQRVWRQTRDRARRLVWLGLGLYAVSAAASLFSLHDVDALLARPVLGVPLLQLAEFAAAALALLGSVIGAAQTAASPVSERGRAPAD